MTHESTLKSGTYRYKIRSQNSEISLEKIQELTHQKSAVAFTAIYNISFTFLRPALQATTYKKF
jgi:hypothetical protein